MKIAFPTEEKNGMDSTVYGHFGSAPHFVIVDSENETYEITSNPDRHHHQGGCQPLAALSGKSVDAVVVGGIGAGALSKLAEAGIRTFRAVEGTIAENFALMKSQQLPQFPQEHTCAGHTQKGSCAH